MEIVNCHPKLILSHYNPQEKVSNQACSIPVSFRKSKLQIELWLLPLACSLDFRRLHNNQLELSEVTRNRITDTGDVWTVTLHIWSKGYYINIRYYT